MLTYLLMLLATSGEDGGSPRYEWKHLYYTVLSREVMLWESPDSHTCILGSGRPELVERLRKRSVAGEAEMLIERLPSPGPLPPLPPGVIINHRYVSVRGVPIEPQCEPSKGLYWIRDYKFISDKIPEQ